jgi:hypothetical protein
MVRTWMVAGGLGSFGQRARVRHAPAQVDRISRSVGPFEQLATLTHCSQSASFARPARGQTMGAFVLIMAFWVSCLPASNVDLGAESCQTSESAEAIRRLLGEFESAQRSALDSARKARTAAERQAADRAMPDRRTYAQRFLELVSATIDEAAAVDALVWVVRHGLRTPEGDEAVQKIADRYLRSDRIATLCHALGGRGPQGESLLKRIFDQNPSPGIRGRACLALALAGSLQLRQVTRTQENLPANRPELAEARQQLLQARKAKTTALTAEIEHRLREVLVAFPGVLLDEDITDSFAFLSENLGPSAGQIFQRIIETHPQSETRWEAECGRALQQTAIASLVADLRSVAALPPESKRCAVPSLAAACVFGGETRLNAVDSKALAGEIEQRLQRIADSVNAINEPGNCYRYLITNSLTFANYHAGIETLLRCAAEGHPNSRTRAAARRSLAIYLAGLADLSRTIDSDRAHWVDRLGEDRVEQIRSLNRDGLMHESIALAAELSKENREAGRMPDEKIEELGKANVRRGGDPARPD